MTDLVSAILEKLVDEQFTAPEPKEVRSLRQKMNLTTRDAAQILNISQRTWERYESGVLTMNKTHWLFLLLITDEVQGFSVLNIGG